MTREEYLLLYKKHLAGNCTPEEEELLETYQDDFRLSDRSWDEKTMGSREAARQEIYRRLEESTGAGGTMRKKGYTARGKEGAGGKKEYTNGRKNGIGGTESTRIPFKKIHLWRAAAAIALLSVVSAVLYHWVETPETGHPLTGKTKSTLQSDVLPGGNKARLMLGDGTELILEEIANGTLRKEGNIQINKSDGQLIYEISGTDPKGKPEYNTVSTPRGGQFQVKLPDGSRVWLNAASSLRFPTAFTGPERRVELTGEGYFEVAGNADMPFKVVTAGMEVVVLGTHFNINAYEDEESIRTTLLEGAVRIQKDGERLLLRPGQQGLLHKQAGSMEVRDINMEAAVAWKNQYFYFDNEDIFSIMRKLSRWYNVEVDYRGDLSGKNFSGGISRFENISEVLSMLELTGVVHFKIEGRRIIVMP